MILNSRRFGRRVFEFVSLVQKFMKSDLFDGTIVFAAVETSFWHFFNQRHDDFFQRRFLIVRHFWIVELFSKVFARVDFIRISNHIPVFVNVVFQKNSWTSLADHLQEIVRVR